MMDFAQLSQDDMDTLVNARLFWGPGEDGLAWPNYEFVRLNHPPYQKGPDGVWYPVEGLGYHDYVTAMDNALVEVDN